MNKKGFTLVELLAVLVILSIITLLVYPIFTSVIKDSKKEIEKTNVNEILNSAYNWSLDNSSILPVNVNDDITVNVETLKKQGYLRKDAIDISTGEEVDDTCIIRITRTIYDPDAIEDDNSKYYSNYLFKFEC